MLTFSPRSENLAGLPALLRRSQPRALGWASAEAVGPALPCGGSGRCRGCPTAGPVHGPHRSGGEAALDPCTGSSCGGAAAQLQTGGLGLGVGFPHG